MNCYLTLKDLLDSTPSSKLDSEHIINARCVRVLTKFIFPFSGQNKSQWIYKPSWTMRSNLSLGHFVTMASLKTLFDLSSGIKFLTSVKLNLIQRCPVYLRLPWLGDISDWFFNQISVCVRKCYFPSNLCVVFRTRIVLASSRKDVLPPKKLFFVLFFYMCLRMRTNQRLNSRIKQRVPTKIRPTKQHIRVFHCKNIS